MNKKISLARFVALGLALTLFTLSFGNVSVEAATPTTSITTNRAEGVCNFTIKDLNPDDVFALKVSNASTNKIVFEKKYSADADGSYEGSFELSDLAYVYGKYTVRIIAGSDEYLLGTCDFSIHTNKVALSITGNSGDVNRTVTLKSTEAATDVIIPGKGNSVTVYAWNDNHNESTAKVIGAKTTITNKTLTWKADVSKLGNYYGTWNVKVMASNTVNNTLTKIASSYYSVIPTQTSLKTSKTKALEKKKAFGVTLDGIKNVFGVKSISFRIYDSAGKILATVPSTKKSETKYSATVTLKKLKYKLDKFNVHAILTDLNGQAVTLNANATVDEKAKKGTLSVSKKGDATSKIKLTKAYIPGNIKKVSFVVFNAKTGKKLATYKSKANSSKTTFTATIKVDEKGKYKVKSYGYTNWGSKLLLKTKTFSVSKDDLGKNGWVYEKYNGKKYKVYYKNNKKLQDLTKVMQLKKSDSNVVNNFHIEVNRAAGVVNIFAKDPDTGKYIIPVKTCSVCVGRDTSTTAGTGGLTEKTSYTPIGSYSVGYKYSNKQMIEPDQSIVYARWATHIVGNVYFHSIAVGSQSHYSLPAYRFNLLGQPASAGCVRMAVADAKWIYDYASKGSSVKIKVGNSKKPGPLGKIKMPTSKVNYDPTDPAVPDSRKKKDYKAKRISGYLKKNGERVGY